MSDTGTPHIHRVRFGAMAATRGSGGTIQNVVRPRGVFLAASIYWNKIRCKEGQDGLKRSGTINSERFGEKSLQSAWSAYWGDRGKWELHRRLEKL
jgi:hypothetical protein